MAFDSEKPFVHEKRIAFLRAVLLVSISILTFIGVALPLFLDSSAYSLVVGEVSPRSIEAPYAHSYMSEILTVDAQNSARLSVQPIYFPADPMISRNQVERLRTALAYISTVREDSLATEQQKHDDLKNLIEMDLQDETIASILSMPDARWYVIQQEALSVLEQVMRNSIRDTQVSEARRSVVTLVSYSLTTEQSELVNSIVSPYVVPNSLYSEELTNAAQQKAADAVKPIYKSYIADEMIVQRGQVISPDIEEALRQYGIVRSNPFTNNLIAALAITLISGGVVAVYFSHRKLSLSISITNLVMISVAFLLFLYAGRLLIPGHSILPYFFPLAAFGLTIASLFSTELGLIFTLILAITTAFDMTFSLDLTLFYAISSMCGILVMGKGRRVTSYVWAGLAISLSGSIIIIAYRLTEPYTDWLGIATLVGTAFLNGIASSSLALLFQFILTQLFGLATPLHLLEISRSDHPLLQFFLQNAPGSYQHSLQVANLAEQAAKIIGADPLLVRVGALYHDVGKAMNPHYFIENQIGSQVNPHDNLSPEESSKIIVQHVTDGMALMKKYRMPPKIRDFVLEHHGTTLTRFQYNKAKELSLVNGNSVNMEIFRYPGPRPQSRETALLMLADCTEAKARADLPKDETELREIVRKAVDICLQQGQLNDTNLTFLDLNRTIESFVFTLRNTYHPRIRYPEGERPTTPLIKESSQNND
jgi:hypothetical protein